MTDQNDTERPPATDAPPMALAPMRFIGETGPLFEALAKAQAEFVEMERDAEVSFDRRMFKYATLAEVLSSVRPALNKYGLAILQPFDGDRVITMLVLGSARLEVDAPLPNWKTVQDLGSALTYVKRYQLKSLLGVNDGEDDDGNTASGTGKTPEPRAKATPPPVQPAPKADISPELRSTIGALAKTLGWKSADLDGFSNENGCGKLAMLNDAKAAVLIKLLESAVGANSQTKEAP